MTKMKLEDHDVYKEMERERAENIALLKRLELTYDDLLGFAAGLMAGQTELIDESEKLIALMNEMQLAIKLFSNDQEKNTNELSHALLELMAEVNNNTAKSIMKGIEIQKTIQAKKGAKAKLAHDPKQLAKKEIEREYESQKTQFKRRGYSAKFARDMLAKYTIFDSIKTIEKLVTKLNKENEHIPR